MNRLLGLLAVVAITAGCVSAPPPQYFTLNMASSSKARVEKVNLEVTRLLPAEALVRNQILIKKSPTEIEYYKRAMWAERIDAVVREKLESEFGPRVDGRKTIEISGEIVAFEQLDTAAGADAHVKMTLEFRPEGTSRYDKPLVSRAYETRVPAKAKGPGPVVEALSEALEQIAREVAGDAAKL